MAKLKIFISTVVCLYLGIMVICSPTIALGQDVNEAEIKIRQDLDKIRAFRTGLPRYDYNEVYATANELLKKYSDKPDVIGRIYLEVLNDHTLSGLFRPLEAIEYAKKAQQYPLSPKDKAQLYLAWGDTIIFTTPGAKGDRLRDTRSKAAEKFLLSMKVLLDNNMPMIAPEPPKLPPGGGAGMHGVIYIPEDLSPEDKKQLLAEKAAIEELRKQNKEYFKALDLWIHQNKIRECTDYSRDLIVKYYAIYPYDTQELQGLATKILGKSEMVDDLISRVKKRINDNSDKDAPFSVSAFSVMPIENIDLNALIETDNSSKPIRWSWIDPNDKKEVTWTAEEAFEDAKKYLSGKQHRQLQALKMFQRVLDAKPSCQMEFKAKLTMGDCMTIYYDSSLGEMEMCNEAFQWYKLLVHDFNDLKNHTDLMTAKIRLSHLYYCQPRYGIIESQKASALCLEVIRVPENDIIFDDELEVGLNLENIQKAKAPGGRRAISQPYDEIDKAADQETRQRLLERRQEVINRYRRLAIQSLINSRHISSDFPPEAFIERLTLLKKERPDDRLYQQMLDDKIQEVSKILAGNHGI